MTYYQAGAFISPVDGSYEEIKANIIPLKTSMGAVARAVLSDYSGGSVLGLTDIPVLGVFTCPGMSWNAD